MEVVAVECWWIFRGDNVMVWVLVISKMMRRTGSEVLTMVVAMASSGRSDGGPSLDNRIEKEQGKEHRGRHARERNRERGEVGKARGRISKFSLPESNGGLNQQRTSICNAVAVAGYLNATIVIPHVHFHSIWRDPRKYEYEHGCRIRYDVDTGIQRRSKIWSISTTKFENIGNSKFEDIYDADYFVRTLENYVRVVDKIPGYIMERFDHNVSNVYNFRVKAWSSIQSNITGIPFSRSYLKKRA
ncbi:unnamed protein product [Ilex paraguariensis]|uniref:O-fucosyltransferase family protein n=1 Tax=Ilex paraguariensis TaxID=185542 RepID=A0ABC8RD43_9AQUA